MLIIIVHVLFIFLLIFIDICTHIFISQLLLYVTICMLM